MFDLFDFVERTQNELDIIAENGNNVQATFDFVERIIRLVAFDNVASTLLLVWTRLNTAKFRREALEGRQIILNAILPFSLQILDIHVSLLSS